MPGVRTLSFEINAGSTINARDVAQYPRGNNYKVFVLFCDLANDTNTTPHVHEVPCKAQNCTRLVTDSFIVLHHSYGVFVAVLMVN